MARNYESVITQIRSAGLLVDELLIGRLVRCRVEGDRERRGWYLLHEIQTSGGDSLLVGSFGIWHGNDNGAMKVVLDAQATISSDQLAAIKKRLKEDREAAERARAAQARRSAERASKAWAKLNIEGDCEYLARKGVQAHGVKFSARGSLVIPLTDIAGRIQGLQIIRTAAEVKAGKREKDFWPAGLAKKGNFHLLGIPGTVILVAEGYATAASLHAATGLPVAVAFDAGNLAPVCAQFSKRYRQTKLLICADDDALAKCHKCHGRLVLSEHPSRCPHCAEPHNAGNAGVDAASSAALESQGAWVRPVFADEVGRRATYLATGRKLTDFNDLHLVDGLPAVRAQIDARLTELRWTAQAPIAKPATGGAGEGALRPVDTVDELLQRYSLVYNMGGSVFDHQEHVLTSISDMRDLCANRYIHRAWAEHPDRKVVRVSEVGFDPSGTDPRIHCNLWAGWPTKPQAGRCHELLDLLRYMCSGDKHARGLYDWVIKWLAYPIQHPGAKMKTTLVLHGQQGTGKNLFFESYMAIYGQYGRVIDQAAIEDKFNDWASGKLFLIADEVVARSDLYHVKNKLKAFITGDWIRINPKNRAAYDERNHCNLVFLSNEIVPVVLEEDDRRHCVISTPDKLTPDHYARIMAEIRDGGIAALHDYLLNLDLGGFTNADHPPRSGAKDALIEQSMDSTSAFYYALEAGQIGSVSVQPALTTDVYALYVGWCRNQGVRAAPLKRLTGVLQGRHKVPLERKRWEQDLVVRGPHGCLLWGEKEQPLSRGEADWLGEQFTQFRAAMNEYLGRAYG